MTCVDLSQGAADGPRLVCIVIEKRPLNMPVVGVERGRSYLAALGVVPGGG